MLVHEQAQQALRRLTEELAERGEHRLPTERALAERLGMSRTTVRRALDLLEREHRIRRVKGRAGGAYLTDVTQREASPQAARPFCQSHSVVRSLNTVKGIPEILHDQGFRDGTTVIRAGLVAAPAPVGSILGVADGEAVVSLLRLRHADGETLSLEQMYLRPELAGVLRTGMTSVYRTLRTQFGVEICVADESIEVASVSSAEGKLLGRPAGTPVLKLERRGFDQRGRAIEYSVDLFRADRTRLHVRTQSPVTAQAM